jgi:hypothetical protein
MKIVVQTVASGLIGIAGVHYLAAELSRRGLVALPTIRNTAGYDIIVARADGTKHANIQVKTSQRKASFWMMLRPTSGFRPAGSRRRLRS